MLLNAACSANNGDERVPALFKLLCCSHMIKTLARAASCINTKCDFHKLMVCMPQQDSVSSVDFVLNKGCFLFEQKEHLATLACGQGQCGTLPLLLRTTSDPLTQNRGLQSLEPLLSRQRGFIVPFIRTASDSASQNSLHGQEAPFSRTKSDPVVQNLCDIQQFCRASSAATKVSHAEPVAGMSSKRKTTKAPYIETAAAEFICTFRGVDEGKKTSVGVVGVKSAPPKGAIRVREKLNEYAAEKAPWPLTASVLDPVCLCLWRAVCYLCAIQLIPVYDVKINASAKIMLSCAVLMLLLLGSWLASWTRFELQLFALDQRRFLPPFQRISFSHKIEYTYPVQIREVAQWFACEISTIEAQRGPSAISTSSDGHIQEPHAVLVSKIKNKFALSQEELVWNTKFTQECYCHKNTCSYEHKYQTAQFCFELLFCYMLLRASISHKC